MNHKISGWSDEEIRAHYREAKNKKQAIRILAQLTLLPEVNVKEIVKGIKARPKPKIVKRKKIDWDTVQQKYDEGKTDAEIVMETGLYLSAIYHWRKRNGLERNKKAVPQGAEHGAK